MPVPSRGRRPATKTSMTFAVASRSLLRFPEAAGVGVTFGSSEHRVSDVGRQLPSARLPRPCKAVVLWSDDPRILLGLRSEHFQLLGTSEAAKGNLTDSQLSLIGMETACKRTERLRSSVPRS